LDFHLCCLALELLDLVGKLFQFQLFLSRQFFEMLHRRYRDRSVLGIDFLGANGCG